MRAATAVCEAPANLDHVLVVMDDRRVVVIGGSEGGMHAVQAILQGLPSTFTPPVFIVLHIGAHPSTLPALLSRSSAMPVQHPEDGERIREGRVYIAPSDHHMMVTDGSIRLTRGPRENFARPSIDPLFRSAAQHYGPRAIGVILTGGLNDGTAGLFEIARQGGNTIVQDPAEALNPSMPESALRHVGVDHSARLAEIPALLVRMVALPIGREITPQIQEPEMDATFSLDLPVALTCPDCGGALRESALGSLKQYRCHIGHAYTADVMLAGQRIAMERSLEAALRALNERAALCRETAKDARATGDWSAAAAQATEQADVLRGVLELEWRHPEALNIER